MSDIQNELKDVLRRRADDVTPPPFSGRQLRRLRLRQAGLILFVSMVMGIGAVGSVIAVRAVRSADDPELAFPQASGPLARSVYAAVPGSEPYESTIHMVRAGPGGPQTIRTFSAGGAPTLALAPDGTRLYVASGHGRGERHTEELVALDVTTGKAEMTAELRPQDELYRLGGGPIPCCSTMELSPDGRWLFLLWVTPGSEGERTFYVATFDTVEGAMLPDMMPLEGCEPGIQTLIPLAGIRAVAVVCEASSDIRFLEASDSGGLKASTRLGLPVQADTRTDSFGNPLQLGNLAWATRSGDASLLYAVTLNGRVFVVDLMDRSVVAEHSIDLGPDSHVGYGKVDVSSNGEAMYLGLGPMSDGFDLTSATQVLEVDTSTWEPVRAIDVPGRFLSMVVTGGDDELYALGGNGLTRLDIKKGEASPVSAVGSNPELVAAP
jgi:hypothetical protein